MHCGNNLFIVQFEKFFVQFLNYEDQNILNFLYGYELCCMTLKEKNANQKSVRQLLRKYLKQRGIKSASSSDNFITRISVKLT